MVNPALARRPWKAVVLCVLAAGCGDALPETVPVAGKVTYTGEPLTSGTVTFHPQEIPDGLPRRPATGTLDAQGQFQLSTFRPGDGAVPGTYRVTVHSYKNRPDLMDDEAVFVPQWRIPQRYGDPAASGLTFDVLEHDGKSDISFDLVD